MPDSNSKKTKPACSCRTCQHISIDTLIDFGPQPRCSDFLTNNENVPPLFDFTLGQCKKCGIIQLKNPIPAKDLHPKFDWIRNKEPDKHAYILVNDLLEYLKNDNSKVLFVSVYDQILYDLIKNNTNKQAYLLDPSKDLDIESSDPGQALIQDNISPEKLKKLSKKIGKFDLIVSCRLLEHAHDTHLFVSSLTQLLKPNGHLVFEVPDSTKSLLQGDVGMLWEEHTNYFTPESLKCGISKIGYQIEKCIAYPYPQEDALLGVFHKKTQPAHQNKSVAFGELNLAHIYANNIVRIKSNIIQYFNKLKKEYGKIVIFGAGHRTIMFLNILNLKHLIYKVIDDDANKQGLIIPKAGHQISNSDIFTNEIIGVCLLSLNIEIENKIIEFISKKSISKIKFYSISTDSNYVLPLLNSYN